MVDRATGKLGTAFRAQSEQRFVDLSVRRSRLSRPEPGRSLGATVARIERPIRRAVQLLNVEPLVDVDAVAAIFECTPYGPNADVEPDSLRLAWFLVNSTILNAFVTKRKAVASITEAIEWFLGDNLLAKRLLSTFCKKLLDAAYIELTKLEFSEDLLDLLPYLIEPHGHITRNSFENDEIARNTRSTKKSAGVYYTPSDVAEFMVSGIASDSGSTSSWLDPACGTGVFLRAILRHVFQHSTPHCENPLGKALSTIYGVDRSALATDSASFVVLIECALLAHLNAPLIDEWRKIKQSVVCMDALRLTPLDSGNELALESLQLATFESLFPKVGCAGFDHVVMNPPYASVDLDSGLRAVWHSFCGRNIGQPVDVHLAFAEMLWRFTSANGSASAVLPLSVAANTSKSFRNFRDELIQSSGLKEFLFFDREPQSLFGEDIKTRNVIIFRTTCRNDGVKTSRLLKWTGKQRSQILSRDRLVEIHPSQCTAYIPKLGSTGENAIYTSIRNSRHATSAARFAPLCQRVMLQEVDAMDGDLACRTVLVSGTAYNFVNAFFASGLPSFPPKPYSSSPVNTLIFRSSIDALAGFSLLSSRLCFWMWHVEGDGFHLTADFLKRLPLWAAFESDEISMHLKSLGRTLWTRVAKAMVGAVNGGKQTYSFHGGYEQDIVEEIDKMLAHFFRLDINCFNTLEEFMHSVISIDGKDRSRCRPDVDIRSSL